MNRRSFFGKTAGGVLGLFGIGSATAAQSTEEEMRGYLSAGAITPGEPRRARQHRTVWKVGDPDSQYFEVYRDGEKLSRCIKVDLEHQIAHFYRLVPERDAIRIVNSSLVWVRTIDAHGKPTGEMILSERLPTMPGDVPEFPRTRPVVHVVRRGMFGGLSVRDKRTGEWYT